MEYVLNHQLPYVSGAQWLAEHVLPNHWVLAVAGTHGKTTTASMLAWILEYAGLAPSFLIGGVARNFQTSARYTHSQHFVIEADEYDTAFFDKRAKFVHYCPRTLLINNLEFDHADIFDDLKAIQRQFHHLIRTVPSHGQIIYPQSVCAIEETLAMGCWTPTETLLGKDSVWQVSEVKPDCSRFTVCYQGQSQGVLEWSLIGAHNMANALGAIACAAHVGVDIQQAVRALADFKAPARRLELIGEVKGIQVYDDFAHHPTAIATTIAGLRAKVGDARIIVLLDPCSYTMRGGFHQAVLADSLQGADSVLIRQPAQAWSVDAVVEKLPIAQAFQSTEAMLSELLKQVKTGDHIVMMSNGSFDGLYQRLLASL